jgi:hypothetical protein
MLTYQCFRLHHYSLGFGTRQSGSVKRMYYCAARVDARICSYLFHIVSRKSDPQAPPQPPHFFHCARQRHIQGSCQEWKNTEALTAKSAISLQEKLADHHRSLEEG